MHASTAHTLRTLPSDIGDHRQEPKILAAIDDRALVLATAAAISAPKRTRADSFTIHAPLELLARAQLLDLAPVSARIAIRLRIAAIAADYAAGDEIEPPQTHFTDIPAALDALSGALQTGDTQQADAATVFLSGRIPVEHIIRALSDQVVAQLGLAAHAPILLSELPRAAARWGDLRMLLRAPLYGLTRNSNPHLNWIDEDTHNADGPDDLFAALARPEQIQSPSLFIAPTMHAVEAGGYAARTLSRATRNLSPDIARPVLARIAALAMLQDDPDHAPYGWTHCFTLPRGVLGLTPFARHPDRLVRIAATHALGFRATLGKTPLTEQPIFDRPEPDPAALAANAGAHKDAHLAKYTATCLSTAREHPSDRPLYLAAASHLADIWRANPDAQFAA